MYCESCRSCMLRNYLRETTSNMWAGQLIRYSDWLRAGRSGDRIPVGARFSAPVQTGPGAQRASCTMCTGSFPAVKSGQGVTLTPHPLLVSWSRKSRAIPLLPSRAIPLLPLWAVRPVESLSACTRVHFTFNFYTQHNNLRSLIFLFRIYVRVKLVNTHTHFQSCGKPLPTALANCVSTFDFYCL